MSKAQLPALRFWAKVAIDENGCWEWQGGTNQGGYGYFNASSTHKARCVLAHRWAWEAENGPIPEGMCVLHRCDNPACVHVDHLFLGTRTDNAADKTAKGRGRGAPGESHPKAKVTEEQVRAARLRFAAGGVTKAALARELGIGHTAMRAILSRKHWRHVEEGNK